MAILQGILKDSLAYYQDLDRRLRARLKELPKGSLFKRRIGRNSYFYLNFRKDGRPISQYLGRIKPEKIAQGISERRVVERQLKEVAQNLKLLERLERRKKRG